MKTISSTLASAINEGNICSIFTIVAKDGTTRCFTDHDKELIVDGKTYIPSAGVTRFKTKVTNDAEVSSQEMAATVLDMPHQEMVDGKWDNAQIESALVAWADPDAGKLINFKGSVGAIQFTDEGFRADVQNYLRDLGRNLGHNVTANCRHVLFSQRTPGMISWCGVNRGSYVSNATVTGIVSQKLKVSISNTGRPAEWASAGFAKFTSGSNAGLTFEIKKHLLDAGETITFYLPTLAQINIGDTLEITAGCDKRMETCKSKFGNMVNFGGFPHLQVDVNSRIETS